jgi:hypothetical protein
VLVYQHGQAIMKAPLTAPVFSDPAVWQAYYLAQRRRKSSKLFQSPSPGNSVDDPNIANRLSFPRSLSGKTRDRSPSGA